MMSTKGPVQWSRPGVSWPTGQTSEITRSSQAESGVLVAVQSEREVRPVPRLGVDPPYATVPYATRRRIGPVEAYRRLPYIASIGTRRTL